MALKNVQFGLGKVAVERRIGALDEKLRDGRLAVYHHVPSTEDAAQRTPVQRYIFHFYRGELAEVEILYDTRVLRAEIGEESFRKAIRSRYEAKEDFKFAPEWATETTTGRRWFNQDTGVEVIWVEDYSVNQGRLTVSWEKWQHALEQARKAYRRRQRLKEQEDDEEKEGVDIGI